MIKLSKKMKHTNFYNAFRSIRAHINNEIKAALRAHGGKYIFHNENDDEWYDKAPLVSSDIYGFEGGSGDVYIASLELDKHGNVIVDGRLKDALGEVQVELDGINIEHLTGILEEMKPTLSVNDISTFHNLSDNNIETLPNNNIETKKQFITLNDKKVEIVPAPIDEKNIISDWIDEELLDNCSQNGNEYLGWLNDKYPVYGRITKDGQLILRTFNVDAIPLLHSKLTKIISEEYNTGIYMKIERLPFSLKASFYFILDD